MMTHVERERKRREHKEAAERRVRRITADADKARLLLVPPEKPVVYSEPVGYIPEPVPVPPVELVHVEPELKKVVKEDSEEAEVTQYVPPSVTPKKGVPKKSTKVKSKPKKSTKVKVG